ncbi:MAG: hypothetical protein WBP12_01605 [Candidatus Saccharimonas sp.]
MVDTILTMPGINAQPQFPWEDLSPSSVDWFATRLADDKLVQRYHLDSEAVVVAFQHMHPAVTVSGEYAFNGKYSPDAIDYGAACVETIHVLVASFHLPEARLAASNARSLIVRRGSLSVDNYLGGAYELFCACMKNTTTVVYEAARRHFGDRASDSVLGASTMWQLLRDSTDEPVSKFDDEEVHELLRGLEEV